MSVHKYALRVPESLWGELVVSARRNGRSVNGEIVWRLSDRTEGATGGVPITSDDGMIGLSGGRVESTPVRSESRRSVQPDFKGGKR
jgi:hypothetical protein